MNKRSPQAVGGWELLAGRGGSACLVGGAPSFYARLAKRESACLSSHHDILYCAQTYVRGSGSQHCLHQGAEGEKEKHRIGLVEARPQGVLSQHGMAQQAKHGGEEGEEEEQEARGRSRKLERSGSRFTSLLSWRIPAYWPPPWLAVYR